MCVCAWISLACASVIVHKEQQSVYFARIACINREAMERYIMPSSAIFVHGWQGITRQIAERECRPYKARIQMDLEKCWTRAIDCLQMRAIMFPAVASGSKQISVIATCMCRANIRPIKRHSDWINALCVFVRLCFACFRLIHSFFVYFPFVFLSSLHIYVAKHVNECITDWLPDTDLSLNRATRKAKFLNAGFQWILSGSCTK